MIHSLINHMKLLPCEIYLLGINDAGTESTLAPVILIVPLFLEQLLTILVGLADTFVVSFVGEAASQ